MRASLARRAATLVIDYALDLDRAQAQIDALIATRDAPPLIDLTLTIADPALQEAGFNETRLPKVRSDGLLSSILSAS